MADSVSRRRTDNPVVRGASFYFGYWGVVGFYVPFLNVHFLQIGLSGSQIALFSTLLPLLMLTTAPLVASLADRLRARVRILAICIAITGITIYLLGVSTNYWVLLALMLLMSIVRSPIAGIGDGLVAKMAVTHNVNFGAMRMWGSFGFAAIAIISGVAWQKFGYQPMFLAACLGFLPVAWLASRLDEEAAAPAQGPMWGPLLRNPAMRTLLITSFLMAGSLSMSGTFEGILMESLGGGGLFIGLLLGVTGMSEIPLMRNAPRLTAWLGGERTLMVGCLIIVLAHIAYAVAWSPVVLLLAAVLRGSGFGLSFVMIVSLVAKRAPAGLAASSQAAMSAAGWGLAPLIGIPLSGLLYDATGGAKIIFVVCMVMALLAALTIAIGLWRGVFTPVPESV